MRTMLVACAIFLISRAAIAANVEPERWTTKASSESCTLSNAAMDASGTVAGRIVIGWSYDGYWLQVEVSQSVPVGRWIVESVGKGQSREIFSGKHNFLITASDAGEKLKVDLASGLEAVLTIESAGKRSRYATSTQGAANALRDFDQCIAKIPNALATPRWVAESTSGRECSLQQSNFGGIRNLSVSFDARPRQGISLLVSGFSLTNPVTGVLRIDLPGAATPWLIGTGKDAGGGPHKAMLLGELRRLAPPHMTFTPHGAAEVEVKQVFDNLDTAVAMFDACAAKIDSVPDKPQVSTKELRYSISEAEGACEFTGVYQFHGDGIWLSVVSDKDRNVLRATRRGIEAGYRVRWLDLEKIGGKKKVEAHDAEFKLDTRNLAALRRDLMGAGREFGITFSSDVAYTRRFGGELAEVQSAMFDACVRSRFDAR